MAQRYPSPVQLAFTLTASLAAAASAQAQTLTASDVLLEQGPVYDTKALSDAIPWDTIVGSGALWDYSWLTVDDGDPQTFQWLALEDAPDAADYPDANYVVRSIGGTNGNYVIDQFYRSEGNDLHELGSAGPVLSYVFTTPELVHVFPQSIGDTASGDHCFTSDGFDIQYHYCGANYVTFDAEGTLVLPYGTYTGVKHVSRWSSNHEETSIPNDSTYNLTQQWFVPGVPHPVLEATVFIDNTGQWWPNGRLMNEASITGLQELATTTPWSMRPNPTTGTIALTGLPQGTQRIDVLGTDGRLVRTLTTRAAVDRASFDLSDVQNGAYLLRVTTNAGATVQRLVVAH